MTKLFYFSLGLCFLGLSACNDDDDTRPTLDVPATYTFERNGLSTVDFSGQTTRIAMATELTAALVDPSNSLEGLMNMYRNEGPNGEDVAPFSSAALNASDKSLRSKVAASKDYFEVNSLDQAGVRTDFEVAISIQANEVFPRWNELAAPGVAGQVADGTRTRYVDDTGLEQNQVIAKSMIGALMLDQAINHYLSPSVLDEAQNRSDNDNGLPEDGRAYTSMEHKWDEAYGYVFGASQDPANPLATLGQDDKFLNEYLARVDEDPDFTGIAQSVFDAFRTGRAAIVAGDYTERDRQAAIIQAALSRVIAVRGVYYLAQGINAIEAGGERPATFHALSEAYGFLYSLQFTRDTSLDAPYFTRTEIQGYRGSFLLVSGNALWDVSPNSLRDMANEISNRFNFPYASAAE